MPACASVAICWRRLSTIEALLHHHRQPAQPRDWIENLQQLLPLHRGEFRRKRDQIGEPTWLFDAAHHRQYFFRHIWQEGDVVLDLLQHGRHRGFGIALLGAGSSWRITRATR